MAKKLYYKIGEACKELDIQPYVLRYWETEFQALSPSKSKSGQRVYSADDLGLIRRIKELLYEEGYTIAGAKKKLEGEVAGRSEPVEAEEEVAGSSEDEPEEEELDEQAAKAAPKPRARKTAAKTKPDPGGAAKTTDDQVAQRAKRLERGIRDALSEVEDLLKILDSH